MRIALVAAEYLPTMGGIGTHVRRLAQGCAEAGDDVTVLTHQVNGYAAEEWIGAVHVLRFPLTVSLSNFPFSRSLFRYLKSQAADFDLVHAHSYHNLVGHAAVSSCLPFVFTPHYHGTGHTPFRAFLHQLYRPAGARQFQAADAVICVSEAERDLVIEHFPVAARKAVVIPNGVEPKSSQSNVGSVHGEPIVLTVGRLERYKNIDLVIDAFRALPTPAILVVVGDGPDRSRLEAHAKAAEPGWPVVFTGRISDPVRDGLLARAHVVTSASDHEAFGITMADGLMSGARVVASAIPAHVELARLAGMGAPVTLVDPRDTRKFADLLAASIHAGRRPTGDLKLPSWTEVVEATRRQYSKVRSQVHVASRSATTDLPESSDARPEEYAPTESA